MAFTNGILDGLFPAVQAGAQAAKMGGNPQGPLPQVKPQLPGQTMDSAPSPVAGMQQNIQAGVNAATKGMQAAQQQGAQAPTPQAPQAPAMDAATDPLTNGPGTFKEAERVWKAIMGGMGGMGGGMGGMG